MPDLLSVDGKHVAEVITTVPPEVRAAENNLMPMADVGLPHCVRVLIPYTIVGTATRWMRQKIKADVLRWTVAAGCQTHWPSRDEQQFFMGDALAPILSLGAYDDGVQAMCIQCCHDTAVEHHQITWSVSHTPSSTDPWRLMKRALEIVEKNQNGGVQALAKKLDRYPTKHLVMYPFGSPGNLTGTLNNYALPSGLTNLMPPRLHPTLVDVRLWLLYRYGRNDEVEGIHMCDGYWASFGTRLPKPDHWSLLWCLHYPDA